MTKMKPKPNYSLIPPRAFESIVNVFTHGAAKHGAFTFTENAEILSSQIEKAMRHIQEWRMGGVADKETEESPLAHAAARLIIALSIINKEDTWSDGPQRRAREPEEETRATAEREFTKLLSRGSASDPKASRRD
jgi:hypothetical protein